MNWHEVFEYDESSPSCLKWAIDIPHKGLFGGHSFKCIKGDSAGCLQTNKTGYSRWKVKYQQKAFMVHRIIYELHFGEIPEGLVIDHRDGDASNNKISNLRAVKGKINARNIRLSNKSVTGFNGVTKRRTGIYEYYAAGWCDLDGRQYSKYFSISKLGEELAEFLAQEYRIHQIDLLNLAGAGYTDRHGT